MNILKGTIEKLSVSGSLTLINLKVQHLPITAIVIDTPETASYLEIGNAISVVFKETEVIIVGIISKVQSKELLSKLTIDTPVGEISSIITTNAVQQLNLTEGIEVTAMIKTNEIMLSE